jgi:hypothetical protein
MWSCVGVVTVPFADLWDDLRHHLLAIVGNLDSVQVPLENANEVIVGYARVLDFEALIAEHHVYRLDARVGEQQLSDGVEAYRAVRTPQVHLCFHEYPPSTARLDDQAPTTSTELTASRSDTNRQTRNGRPRFLSLRGPSRGRNVASVRPDTPEQYTESSGSHQGRTSPSHHFVSRPSSQLLDMLLRHGRLSLAGATLEERVTFHDSCFLGRHNDVYLAPRRVVGSLAGIDLVEMPRNGTNGMCCGAGGARMWMEESTGKKINAERSQEAIATGASRIAVACPFCYVMLDDGVKGEDKDEEVRVQDIAEILWEAMESSGAQPATNDN